MEQYNVLNEFEACIAYAVSVFVFWIFSNQPIFLVDHCIVDGHLVYFEIDALVMVIVFGFVLYSCFCLYFDDVLNDYSHDYSVASAVAAVNI